MKIVPKLKRASGSIVILAFLGLVFALSFFLTAFIYEKVNWHPSSLAAQVITSLLGLVFSFLILYGASFYFRSRQKEFQRGMIGPVIAALEKIARGDFNVRLEDTLKEQLGPFNRLVDSVNSMALGLSQVEKMRQEFISDVSHEIQSPLTSIRGFARALRNNSLGPEEQAHYLNIIETESIRLSKLSDNLLQLASLDSDNIQLEPKPYRLDKQVRRLVLACEPQWLEKEIELEVALEAIEATADEDLLSQVWINLIHNSIKFTPACGRISINLQHKDGTNQFTVTDTGIGISEEDQPHVFERFFKADRSRQRASSGSGLGLSIAKKIVEIHHGTIQLDSKPGKGTTFIVSLPAADNGSS